MDPFFKTLENKKITLPGDVEEILKNCVKYTVYDSVEQLATAAVGGKDRNTFEVSYEIPGKVKVTEATVNRVSNGISVNYTEPYMRRRDPDTMFIADELPSDKKKFKTEFGYDFHVLESETFNWLKKQELAVFLFFAGRENIGLGGIAVAPANAGFFAWDYRCSRQ